MSELIKVANKKDLGSGRAIAVTVKDKTIAVFNIDGQFYAIDDACSHAGGPLSEGEVNGTIVTCPWHGATFDVTTGEPLNGIASDSLGRYPVVVEGEDIKIQIP